MNNLLEPVTESGNPVEERLKNADSGRQLFEALRQADEISQQNRTVVQAMIDGAPPYDPVALELSGAGYRYNINHGEGSALLEAALTSYTDLMDSVESLIQVKLPPNIGDSSSRVDMQDVIAEEFTSMVKDWPEFDANYQRLVTEMNTHGIGWAFFPHDEDWKWQPEGLDNTLIPRQTMATEEAIEVLIVRKPTPVHRLYKHIADETLAADLGWDVDEVKKQLVRTTRSKTDMRGWAGEWARLQRELKNNDLWVGHADAQQCTLLHAWVREFDGTYSHYIFNDELGEFLYKKRGRFQNANNAFVSFTNTISPNGTYHGTRGLAYRAFPIIQAMNRLRCAILDGTQISNTLYLQPKDNASMEEAPLLVNGPLAYLSSDFEFADVKFQNPARESLEVVRELGGLVNSNTPTYRSNSVNAGGEKTKYEVMASQELDSALSVTAVNMFYRAWAKLVKEMFRRTVAIGGSSKDFPEVKEFFSRCNERGVPAEVIKKVRCVTPMKAIGSGSVSARMVAFDEAMQLIGSFDEAGRRNVVRDRIAARMGRETADRYLPRAENPRPVIDVKIAELENAALRAGNPVEVLEGEDHFTHCESHFEAILEAEAVWEKLRQESNLDFEQLVPELEFVTRALDHVGQHIPLTGFDKRREADHAAFRKAYQNAKGRLENFLSMYQRYLRDNRRQSADELPDKGAQAGAPGSAAPVVDPQTGLTAQQAQELKYEAIKKEQRIAALREEAQVKLGLNAQEIEQRLAAKRAEADIKAASEISKLSNNK